MKSKHLTLDQRKAIQDGIENRLSKTAIARLIGKDPSTVAKEITAHRNGSLTAKVSKNRCKP